MEILVAGLSAGALAARCRRGTPAGGRASGGPFQIWFRALRFDSSGNAHPEAQLNPLMFHDNHGPVAHNNMYIRTLRPIVTPVNT